MHPKTVGSPTGAPARPPDGNRSGLRNVVRIDGDVAYLEIAGSLEAAVDVSDLALIGSGFGRWVASRKPAPYATARRLETGQLVLMHRLLTGAPSGMLVDHINHNTLDNRRSNLRVVTHQTNCLNKSGARRDCQSGVRGVSLHYGRWRARIVVDGKFISLGAYETKEEASRAFEDKLLEVERSRASGKEKAMSNSVADLERQVAELTARLNDAAQAGARLADENARLRAEVQRLGARLEEQRLKTHRSEDQISDECMAEAEIADENRALRQVAEAARVALEDFSWGSRSTALDALRAALAKLDATRK